MEQQAGREQKYESGKKNHLWDHGRNPVHGGTGERIRDDEGRDMEKGYKKRGIKVKAGQPANFYCISCVPWAAFTAFGSRTVNSTEPVYFPIITMGKYEKSGDRILMPVNLMIAHAVADGYHAGMFFQRLQEAVDRLSKRNQDPE